MLFYAVQLAAGEVQTEVESAALLAEFLKLENCEISDFHQRLRTFAQILSTSNEHLLLSVHFSYCRGAATDCVRRCSVTQQRSTHPQYASSIADSSLISSKPGAKLGCFMWMSGTAEVVLAKALGVLNHPLVAHVPAKVLEDMCRAGGLEKFAETTPQGEERPLASFVRRAAADVLWIVNLQGAESQNHQITFLWKSLKAEPALCSTIVISGWHSEKSDYFGDWKQIIDHSLQGTVMGLKWDVDITTYFLWQTCPNTGGCAIRVSKHSAQCSFRICAAIHRRVQTG